MPVLYALKIGEGWEGQEVWVYSVPDSRPKGGGDSGQHRQDNLKQREGSKRTYFLRGTKTIRETLGELSV